MINGDLILKQKYPDFDESSRTPNGLDLRLGKVYELSEEHLVYGLYEDKKLIPEHVSLPMEESVRLRGGLPSGELQKIFGWHLQPHRCYILEVNKKIKISDDCAQVYKPRSTLLRAGVSLLTAMGDSSYFGNLAFLCINHSSRPFFMEQNVRFAQLIDLEVKENSLKYDGDYQEKE